MRKAVAILILGLITPLLVGAQDQASLEAMRQAAEKGNADAQLEMGILYEFGYNMPKNDVSALAWYLRSAEQGNELAIKRRDTLKSHMKPDEIEAAQKLAGELGLGKTGAPEAPAAADKQPEITDAPPASEPAGEKPAAPAAAGEKPPASP